MDIKDEARRLLDRTRTSLRPVRDGIVRTYEVSTLKLEIAGLRRSLDDVARELGLRAIDTLRERGTLSAEDVPGILRRVDDLDDRIAQKEREIAEIERSDAAPDPPQT